MAIQSYFVAASRSCHFDAGSVVRKRGRMRVMMILTMVLVHLSLMIHYLSLDRREVPSDTYGYEDDEPIKLTGMEQSEKG